jgi:glycosyltransferase involved in cell wall biosynthesis
MAALRTRTSWPSKLVIMMPVFNDWEATGKLLERLDDVLHENRLEARVLLINDGSSDPMDEDLCAHEYAALVQVQTLSLRRNVGNQRAIAIGISYVQEHVDCEALLIMDGDGEDDPRDVPRLVESLHQHDERCIVFAARMKRSESWVFRIFYLLYRLSHLLLTGIAVRVGNFSIVPAAHLKRLVLLSEMWNHYAAAVLRSRIPYQTLHTHRAARLAGCSRMNFVGLVAHGLSAISVFSEVVAVRLLLANGLFAGLTVLCLLGALGGVLLMGWSVPAWTYQLIGVLAVMLAQCLVLAVLFVMVLLGGRSSTNFLPVRDYSYFVAGCETLFHSPLFREDEAAVAERADVAGV